MTTPITPAQLARVRAVVFEKAKSYPELQGRVTLAGIKRVLAREQIILSVRFYPKPAQLVRAANGWKIVVDRRTTDAERLVLIVHELAHRWLHVDDSEPVEFDRSPAWHDDQREAEANALTEMLLAAPLVKKARVSPSAGRKSRRATLSAETARQLRFLDDDPDETMLRTMARDAIRQDAANAPVGHGRVQFALSRAAWNAISLVGRHVPMPHYTNVMTGPDFELVTATLETAVVMVELLARAGYKRTAVYVRRTIREAADPYEVREQHRTVMIREGAKRMAGKND